MHLIASADGYDWTPRLVAKGVHLGGGRRRVVRHTRHYRSSGTGEADIPYSSFCVGVLPIIWFLLCEYVPAIRAGTCRRFRLRLPVEPECVHKARHGVIYTKLVKVGPAVFLNRIPFYPPLQVGIIKPVKGIIHAAGDGDFFAGEAI